MLVWGAGGLRGPGLRLVKHASRVSFSLFLTHAFAGALWFGALHAAVHRSLPPAVGWAVWVGGLAFALGLALAFDQLVDAPAQAWLKRRRNSACAPRPHGVGAAVQATTTNA
jgi:peptidoglycan/LPS O-acetylase OafA/YrhL